MSVPDSPIDHRESLDTVDPEKVNFLDERIVKTSPSSSHEHGLNEDVLSLQDLDPALNAKMRLVNDAIDEIGWTPYHTKLFCLNGFGYAVDSLILLLQSVIATSAFHEFGREGYAEGLNVAAYTGMLVGAAFWGLGSDIFGRKHAFNISLFLCAFFSIVAGFMPNWPALGTAIALIGFGGGGNLVLDTTVFLEFLPGRYQYVVTLMAMWWGIGMSGTGLLAWIFMVPEKWNCAEVAEVCTRDINKGWRFVMITGGVVVLFLSILRVSIVKLKETPKYLLGIGKDEEVVETLQYLAKKYDRPCSLTLEALCDCGKVCSAHSENLFSLAETWIHVKGLFGSTKMGISFVLIFLVWSIIGLAYPLFMVFLPQYLTSQGARFEETEADHWRNYVLSNITGIFGPVLAAWLCNIRLIGRRYTMVIGALGTMSFLFAYTEVRTEVQTIVFPCMVNFWINVYYGVLYAYTPEVLPSAHRTTGNGLAVVGNRIMGILSSVIATATNTATETPIYVCAVLFGVLAVLSALMPFEPAGRRSS